MVRDRYCLRGFDTGLQTVRNSLRLWTVHGRDGSWLEAACHLGRPWLRWQRDGDSLQFETI
ncbi:hypothetical protein IscW_ISCW005950 [Ixodes scapularis]|uniref:Uncharacterized protein n=1 Tax=Ixodes scapularis TaxID=6945 RepID=B7PMH7_IXOSC|nr:hypothetical protein IscW_ISCW005950 [Ixodes scapularis]|eukprot:XP_002434975.1 hypothetical protein IscW_ISCW005950 [Ixodes scapularis]